jgi:NAD-dependent dihydropyrimidine dehydrogenase PreA subunit
MKVISERCKGCGSCVPDCPQAAIKLRHKLAFIGEACSECGACARICPQGAILFTEKVAEAAVICESCPVQCRIKEGFLGACQRYVNRGGSLQRTVPLKTYEDVEGVVGPDWRPEIRKPLITGIGAGTTYPDCKFAPHIVQSKIEGVDVVTVVTEAPLSYSGIKLKIDTDVVIGEERAPVLYKRKKVGHLTTEEYGSKILAIGGVNTLTGKEGFAAARLIADIANRKKFRLRIQGGSQIEARVGAKPIIDDKPDDIMRVGCGSATLGLFAQLFKDVADEVIIIDSHVTGLMSEHAAGIFVGAKPSGVKLRFSRSTPGRYFGDHGPGWGGTSIVNPVDIIESIDLSVARPGSTILITETTGRKAALFQLGPDGSLTEIPLSGNVTSVMRELSETCEQSRVSAVYCGGSGGSARAGVTKYPIKLTRAVHAMKARLTVGGAPTFVLPGGGINFMVDVEKVMPGAFTWAPTPSTICPIEYTMTLEDYLEMGGHAEAIKPFKAGGSR